LQNWQSPIACKKRVMNGQKFLCHRWFPLLNAQILLRSLDSGKLEKVPKRQGMSASTKAIESVQGEWSGKAL